MALEIRVLVVEDDPETRMLTEALLSGRKGVCLCALAKDGLEGLELVEQTRPDIVLLDQMCIRDSFYKLPPERVLVISDDVSLPVGKLRIRKGGSAGGHNGLKSIIQHLGTDQFPRIKVGVGQKPHPDYDMADWVLSKFAGEDLKTITEAIRKAADAVECLIQEGPDKAMNRFNG